MKPKHIIQLGTQEHELLRAMARPPRAVALSSTQRLRFELLGLIEDRADGIALTERGRALAEQPASAPEIGRDQDIHRGVPRDKRGRRLGHQRHTPF